MKKKTLVVWVVTTLLVVISGASGYVTAYVKGLQKLIDMDVRIYCHVLLLESLTLARKSESLDIAALIDGVTLSCSNWASFIRANKPYSNPDTKKRISEALEEWEKAKRKLEKLRILYVEKTDNNKAVERLQDK